MMLYIKPSFLKVVAIVGVILLATTVEVLGQRDEGGSSGKLVKSLPGVYLTFLRYEDHRVKDSSKVHRIAWLRLSNNMRLPIKIEVHDGSFSPVNVIGPRFEVEKNPDLRDPSSRDNSKIPFGTVFSSSWDVKPVISGGNFEFPLVVDDYLENTRIKIRYFFDWEDVYTAVTGNEPSHYIFFYLRNLPKQ